LAKITITKIVA